MLTSLFIIIIHSYFIIKTDGAISTQIITVGARLRTTFNPLGQVPTTKSQHPELTPALSVSSVDDGSDIIFTMMEEATLQKKKKVNKVNII